MVYILVRLKGMFQVLIGREEGQDLVEYGLLVSLIALGSIAAVGKVATALAPMFTNISTKIA